MSLFSKLLDARTDLRDEIKTKSGYNDFSKFDYFELSDILPAVLKMEHRYNIISIVRFGVDVATLTVYDLDDLSQCIEFTSPMAEAEIKGCHKVQNLGAVETYIRRYLYLIAYEIIEPEYFDKVSGKKDFSESESTERRSGKKPEQKEKGKELSLEEAGKLCFSSGSNKGIPFSKLESSTLEWAVKNCKNELLVKGAKIILDYREKREPEDFEEDFDEDFESFDPSDEDIPY